MSFKRGQLFFYVSVNDGWCTKCNLKHALEHALEKRTAMVYHAFQLFIRS